MTPHLAALHRHSFPAHPRAWSAAEIDAMLASTHNFLLQASGDNGPSGFLVARAVAGEAELLTLAVAPEARRQGVARALMGDFYAAATARGATVAFLEVASDNAPARALYLGDGWIEAGLRRNYYAPGIDAILMRRDLQQG